MRWLLACLVLGGFGCAQVQVANAWVRWVPGTTTAAYMRLLNPGSKPVRIVGFTSPVARRSQLHQTQDLGQGVTGMRAVEALVIPARGSLELKPGGTHLMLVGLTQPLKAGQTVHLVLHLEKGQTLAVNAVVRP